MSRRPEQREQYGGGRILIQEYNPKWPLMFERERAAIAGCLDRYVVAIEHIGSTAVPGLPAKPIIDLLVGVEDLAAARSGCLTELQARGYAYMAEYETWLPGEMLFRKGMPGPWTHHAHVVEASRSTWSDYLLLRDYLRSHEEVARAYGNVKSALAVVFEDDIAGYRSAKRPFVERVIAKARAEVQAAP
jgi:GrpB-like predicted nucleotidyltransferase (UPF0157 family)